MKKIYCLLLLSFSAYSQIFYEIGTNEETGSGNTCKLVNLSNCTKSEIVLCATIGTSGDIAVDRANNLYYISSGKFLYKQNLIDNTCELIGTFPIHPPALNISVNALVADTNGNLYASATDPNSNNDNAILYKYTPNEGIIELGFLIPHHRSLGDLFFFENRLFWLSRNHSLSQSSLVEVNIIHPNLSTIYMDLTNFNIAPYGAFSVLYNGFSKSYLLQQGFVEGQGKIFELDIPQQTVTLINCYMNATLNGADAYYEFSNPLNNHEYAISELPYFRIQNPIRDNIVLDTNVSYKNITEINLFDLSGRNAKKFTKNIEINLPISELASGLYNLNIKTNNGQFYNQKVVIQH